MFKEKSYKILWELSVKLIQNVTSTIFLEEIGRGLSNLKERKHRGTKIQLSLFSFQYDEKICKLYNYIV